MTHQVAFTAGVRIVPVLFGDISVDIPMIRLVLVGDEEIDFESIAESPAHLLHETKVHANLAYVEVETKLRESDSDESNIFAIGKTSDKAPFTYFRLELTGMEYNRWKVCRGKSLGRWAIHYQWGENHLLIIMSADGTPLSVAERFSS